MVCYCQSMSRSWGGLLRPSSPTETRPIRPSVKAKLIYERSHHLLSCHKAAWSLAILYVCDGTLWQNAFKMEMSLRVLGDFQPIYSVASQREPRGILDFVWFNANRWMRNFPPPPPSPGVTRPFFLLPCWIGPQPSRHRVLSQIFRLQHPCAIPGKESMSSPHWTERLTAFLPLHHCNPAECRNLDSRTISKI